MEFTIHSLNNTINDTFHNIFYIDNNYYFIKKRFDGNYSYLNINYINKNSFNSINKLEYNLSDLNPDYFLRKTGETVTNEEGDEVDQEEKIYWNEEELTKFDIEILFSKQINNIIFILFKTTNDDFILISINPIQKKYTIHNLDISIQKIFKFNIYIKDDIFYYTFLYKENDDLMYSPVNQINNLTFNNNTEELNNDNYITILEQEDFSNFTSSYTIKNYDFNKQNIIMINYYDSENDYIRLIFNKNVIYTEYDTEYFKNYNNYINDININNLFDVEINRENVFFVDNDIFISGLDTYSEGDEIASITGTYFSYTFIPYNFEMNDYTNIKDKINLIHTNFEPENYYVNINEKYKDTIFLTTDNNLNIINYKEDDNVILNLNNNINSFNLVNNYIIYENNSTTNLYKYIYIKEKDINSDIVFINLLDKMPPYFQENDGLKKIVDLFEKVYNNLMRIPNRNYDFNDIWGEMENYLIEDRMLYDLYKNNPEYLFYDKNNLIYFDGNIFEMFEKLIKNKNIDEVPINKLDAFLKQLNLDYIYNKNFWDNITKNIILKENGNDISFNEGYINKNKENLVNFLLNQSTYEENYKSKLEELVSVNEREIRKIFKIIKNVSNQLNNKNFYKFMLYILGFFYELKFKYLSNNNKLYNLDEIKTLNSNFINKLFIEINVSELKENISIILNSFNYLINIIKETLPIHLNFTGILYKFEDKINVDYWWGEYTEKVFYNKKSSSGRLD